MKLLVINNKCSGLGDSDIYDFIRIATQEGDDVVIRNLSPKRSIAEMLVDARDFDCVVAAGGDGTVASVCYELRYTDVPILIFPAGTANLLAMNLDSSNNPRELARLVREGQTARFDICEIEYVDVDGVQRKHGFGVIAGAGYDSKIMESANRLKKSIGSLAYYLSFLTNSPDKLDIELIIDGVEHRTEGMAALLVNFARVAPDISIIHENDAQDGLFDIVVLKPDKVWKLAPTAISALLDAGGQFPERGDAIDIFSGREVYVRTEPPVRIQFDGEVLEATTPFVARVLPRSFRAIVSDEEAEHLKSIGRL